MKSNFYKENEQRRKKKLPRSIAEKRQKPITRLEGEKKPLLYNVNYTTHVPTTIRPQLSSIAHCFCPLKLGLTITFNKKQS